MYRVYQPPSIKMSSPQRKNNRNRGGGANRPSQSARYISHSLPTPVFLPPNPPPQEEEFDNLCSKPKPKQQLTHLVGRPLVPFFIQGQENTDHRLDPAASQHVNEAVTIPVRKFEGGYFLAAQPTPVPQTSMDENKKAAANLLVKAPEVPTHPQPRRHVRSKSPPAKSPKKHHEHSKTTIAAPQTQFYAAAAFMDAPHPVQLPLPSFLVNATSSAQESKSVLSSAFNQTGFQAPPPPKSAPPVSAPTELKITRNNSLPSEAPKLHFLSQSPFKGGEPTKIEVPLVPVKSDAPRPAQKSLDFSSHSSLQHQSSLPQPKPADLNAL